MPLTTVSPGMLDSAAQYYSFKNRIINGAMVIDQRNNGAEVNPAVSGTYYLDRWQAASGAASKFKIGRNAGGVTPPAGFSNYLGCTSLSAYSVGAGEVFQVRQPVEANNVADLAWGTANAVGVTVSFWVYSSLTGTFGGAIRNATTYNYSYPFTYSVSAANTWEYKTIFIPGPTAGTWGTGTSTGLELGFSLGSGTTFSGPANAWASANYTSATGAVSVVGTNGATFYITGVQLEKGSTATSFDYRPYGTELALCQRYAFQLNNQTGSNVNARYGFGSANATTAAQAFVVHPVTMRTIPSLTVTNIGSFILSDTTFGIIPTSITQQTNVSSQQASCLNVVVSSGATIYRPYFLEGGAASNGQLLFSAEL